MEKNYFTDLVGIGVTYPIQLTTNEKGERGWYPVSDFSLTGGILLLGLVCTLLPFLLYTRGLSRMDSGKASVLAFAEPLTATLMGVVAFGEVPDGFGWLGVILLFGALVLLQMPQKQRKTGKIPNIL